MVIIVADVILKIYVKSNIYFTIIIFSKYWWICHQFHIMYVYIFHVVNEDNKKAGTIELDAETGHVEDYTY